MMNNYKWGKTETYLKKYPTDKYFTISLDIQEVEPIHIVALSRVLDPNKLELLARRVQENGWNDPLPRGIELLKLPNGKYVVGGGGNHRSFYSKENGIPKIKAVISAIVPFSKLSQTHLDKISEFDSQLDNLHKELICLPDGKKRFRLLDKMDELEERKVEYLKSIYPDLMEPKKGEYKV